MADAWTKPYSREYAAFPAPWLRVAKFWPTNGKHVVYIIYNYVSFDIVLIANLPIIPWWMCV